MDAAGPRTESRARVCCSIVDPQCSAPGYSAVALFNLHVVEARASAGCRTSVGGLEIHLLGARAVRVDDSAVPDDVRATNVGSAADPNQDGGGYSARNRSPMK